MASLSFTLLPPSVSHLHDVLSCLIKFDENIFLEASAEGLRISSLNSSKTAYASFRFDATAFFSKYSFRADPAQVFSNATPGTQGRWSCQLQNRALLSIFKKRLPDNKDRDTALEYSEVELREKSDQTKCRLVVRTVCHFGVVKTYRLTYEAAEIMHATFDKNRSINNWTVSARTLRDVVEYFGPKTDQLDWYFENGKVTFTSYTEKVTDSRDPLKATLHTSVSVERADFSAFAVEEKLHIGIILKDFRAIIAHADTMEATITARYSRGNRPMQISYAVEGILSEFTLMTRGKPLALNSSANNTASSTPARDLSIKPVIRQQHQQLQRQPISDSTAPPIPGTTQGEQQQQSRQRFNPPPPARPTPTLASGDTNAAPANALANVSYASKPGPSFTSTAPPPSASIDPHSIFVPQDDDDGRWDPDEFDAGPIDYVRWDTSEQADVMTPTGHRIRDIEPGPGETYGDQQRLNFRRDEGIPPTQRISQIKGLFD